MKTITRIALIGFLFSFSFTASNAQTTDSLIVQLSRKWINAKAYAIKMAELMPENEYDFKPVPDEMSFKQQLLHLADNIVWLSTSYLAPSIKRPAIDTANLSKRDVIKILDDAYNIGLVAQNRLSLVDMDKKVDFFAGPKTIRQILILMHDHQSHHVGQIIVYLRLRGIHPPDYVGW
ncbi:MAG TPA: DinB family protein [Puia sp.]|nr:DinB family protein [Puia sp.]